MNSKQISTLSLALPLSLAWAGCASTTASPAVAPTETTAAPIVAQNYPESAPITASGSAPAPQSAASGPTPVDPPLSDGQIAGIASRVDEAEIDAAKLALKQGKSATVRQFAQHMISAHTAVESSLKSTLNKQGIQTAQSSICDKLTHDTADQKQTLMGQTGLDFDREYLTAQLKDHQDVLSLMDTKLIPDAQNPQLKAAMQSTREKVVGHIQMAKDALAALPAH